MSNGRELAKFPANGYMRDNILGTVSQVDGVSTGAIIERGSNANGEYVRFADGTQVCTHTLNPGPVNANGSGTYAAPYRSPTFPWEFPADFAISPQVSGFASTVASSGSHRVVIVGCGTTKTTQSINDAITPSGIPYVQVSAISGNAPDVCYVSMTAIGRWHT